VFDTVALSRRARRGIARVRRHASVLPGNSWQSAN